MLYPLTFNPIFKERLWGGRKLAELYHKPLPPKIPIGESWEVSDRDKDVSRVSNGPLAGQDLHSILVKHSSELLGKVKAQNERFPLLIKILDAQDTLSLQVHPPGNKARALGGEPKTEMWYIADAAPDAELFVGLKQNVTRKKFEESIRAGSVADCVHRVKAQAGDAWFLPSGRVHAIGAGLVIFEIQQNSDTTYRVFDWNRVGLDGKPRALHVAQSLESINFNDFEPQPVPVQWRSEHGVSVRSLVNDPLFSVELWQGSSQRMQLPAFRMQILGVVSGKLAIQSGGESVHLVAGGFCLVPACAEQVTVTADNSTFLRVESGHEE